MLCVRGKRTCTIDDEIVQLAPVYLAQELLDECYVSRVEGKSTVLLGSSPDHRIVRIFQQETNTHHRQIVVHINRIPATVALMNLPANNSHHTRDTGTTDIDVENTHLEPLRCKPKSQLGRNRTFPHPSLSGKDHDNVLN